MSTVKLTPSIKQLLSSRRPNPQPGPSLSRLSKVFAETFRDAQTKKAETGWLVAATCALLTANRPSAVGHLYRFVTRSAPLTDGKHVPLDVPKAVNRAAIMRESALKSVIFVGVPRIILSLAALHEVLDEDVKKALSRSYSRRTIQSDNVHLVLARGRILWDDIYQPFTEKLHDKLASYHPDFISFIIQCYGSVLSPLPGKVKAFHDTSSSEDPDQGNLSRAVGSVVGVACLRAEGEVGPQLTSHTFGLLKAREIENQSAEDRWLASDEGAEWVIRTVDEILDCVFARDETKGEDLMEVGRLTSNL